jgi:VWFA-related protein
MCRNPISHRSAAYHGSLAAVLLLNCLPAFSQASKAGQSFPTQDNPRIVISNPSTVSIIPWDKREVSVIAEVAGVAVHDGELAIKPQSKKVNISCNPSKPDRNITLTLSVPSKAIIEIKAYGNRVEIKEPGRISLSASKEQLLLSVPESSSLDMQEAPNAFEARQLGPGGYAQMGIGGRRSGNGTPYVKVSAATARVAITRGIIKPMTRVPTLASSTIARRGGVMGQALRGSNPQLVRPQHDQPAAVDSTAREEGSLRLETHLVNLNVGVTDRVGKAIPGLKQEDFKVDEDGVPQQISFFSPEQSPFNLVLLLDLSGSMREEIDLIKETANHFLDIVSPQDSIAVVTFSTDVTVVSRLTRDRDDLRESIELMLPPTGGTAFYDALAYSLVEILRKVKGQRNAVIAITDGEDNNILSELIKSVRPAGVGIPPMSTVGSFLTFAQLLDGVTEADAVVYPIHLDPAMPPAPQQPQGSNPGPAAQSMKAMVRIQPEMTAIARKQLQSLAEATGGRMYHANRIEDLHGVFEQVAAELRTVYSIGYSPANLNFDGRFRRIRVHLNRPDVGIRTRPGYFGK